MVFGIYAAPLTQTRSGFERLLFHPRTELPQRLCYADLRPTPRRSTHSCQKMPYRAFASSRSKTNPGGSGRLSFRRRSIACSRVRSFFTANLWLPATVISISSPSFNSSASTIAAGNRIARLFPHFATFMRSPWIYISIVYPESNIVDLLLAHVSAPAESRNPIYKRPHNNRDHSADQAEAVAAEQSDKSHHDGRADYVEKSPAAAGNFERARQRRLRAA